MTADLCWTSQAPSDGAQWKWRQNHSPPEPALWSEKTQHPPSHSHSFTCLSAPILHASASPCLNLHPSNLLFPFPTNLPILIDATTSNSSSSPQISCLGFISFSLLIRIDSRDTVLVVASFALREVKLLAIQVRNLFSVLNLESYCQHLKRKYLIFRLQNKLGLLGAAENSVLNI